MNILIISGEISGDLYASYLTKSLKELSPNTTIFGIGGNKLKETADHFLFESAYSHGIGIQSVINKKKFKTTLLNSIKTCLNTHSISRTIIIDFQHYNFDIAQLIQSQSICIDTFITPNFWMWHDKTKASAIIEYSRYIFTIFEKEFDFYNSLTPKVFYFGHPLTDHCFKQTYSEKNQHSKPNIKTIAFLPGSRKQELKLYLNSMLKTILILQKQNKDYSIKLSVSAPQYKAFILNKLKKFNIPSSILSYDTSTKLYNQSDIVIVASGTTTLEGILTNTPIIVLASLPFLSYWYAKLIMKLKFNYVALPNFISDSSIVPELVQHKVNTKNILKELSYIKNNYSNCLNKYKKIKKIIQKEPFVFNSIARKILS